MLAHLQIHVQRDYLQSPGPHAQGVVLPSVGQLTTGTATGKSDLSNTSVETPFSGDSSLCQVNK